MKIQSISIVVPTKGCVNDCKFCVSKMRCDSYNDNFSSFDIEKRIKFAVNNGVNTCIITGTGEALQNKSYLNRLSEIFSKMKHPFPNVEIQTTGVMLFDNVRKENGFDNEIIERYPNIELLKKLGVNTISLSVSNIFDDERNMEVIGVSDKLKYNLDVLIQRLKKHGFNIRLSLNMIDDYVDIKPNDILNRCKELGANQVTFRKMYFSLSGTKEDVWVRDNASKMIHDGHLNDIKNYITSKGTPLYKLPFGAIVYSLNGLSTVIDDDCMSKQFSDEVLKYVILREDGKLYCRWDDEGSLIF